jgi:hypothetical protein
MPGLLDPNRQYSDREVRLILESAAKLQTDRPEETSGGMTLAQLEQVAAEAGLDPRLIRRAAEEIGRVDPPSDHNAFFGGPTVIVLERVVDASIDVAEFDQLLEVTRRLTRGVGEVSMIGRQFGWKGFLEGANTEVSVSTTDEQTTVRVRVQLDDMAMGHFAVKTLLAGGLGGFAAAGFVTSITLMTPLGIAAGALTLGAGYLWSRRSLAKAGVTYRGRANALLEELAARVRMAASSPRAETQAVERVRP